jgi:hypothetical protein
MTDVTPPGQPPLARARRALAPAIRGAGHFTGKLDGAPSGPPSEADIRSVATPVVSGERFRRSTPECLLAAAAARAAVADADLPDGALAGHRTGVLYVTATAYATANREFLVNETSATLHFPYTAPSAVPGEVTIDLGLHGPYVTLMGGGPTALESLWWAARWLGEGLVDHVLVLAVETVQGVRDLAGKTHRLLGGALVEGAACLLLERGEGREAVWASGAVRRCDADAAVAQVVDAVLADCEPSAVESTVGTLPIRRVEGVVFAHRGLAAGAVVSTPRAEMLACGPLMRLATVRASRVAGACLLTAAWRGEYGAVLWPL